MLFLIVCKKITHKMGCVVSSKVISSAVVIHSPPLCFLYLQYLIFKRLFSFLESVSCNSNYYKNLVNYYKNLVNYYKNLVNYYKIIDV